MLANMHLPLVCTWHPYRIIRVRLLVVLSAGGYVLAPGFQVEDPLPKVAGWGPMVGLNPPPIPIVAQPH